MFNTMATISASQVAPVMAAAAIDVDGTIIVQMILFFFVLFFLHFVLFRPYLQAVDAREDGVEGAREEAAEMETRAGRVIEEYEEKMRQARRDAQDVRESLRNQGIQKQNDMVQEVREEIQGKLKEERDRIAKKVDSARSDIEKRAQGLADAMTAKILPS
ncbi:ATP synthase F0 subunit B [Persicimonas caeni]|nr:ATP synthase F0 subunit B [Persicimonas caeni]